MSYTPTVYKPGKKLLRAVVLRRLEKLLRFLSMVLFIAAMISFPLRLLPKPMAQHPLVVFVYFVSSLVGGFVFFPICILILINMLLEHSLKSYSMDSRLSIIRSVLQPSRYEPDNHALDSVVRSTGFYPKWTTCWGSDLLEMEYRGVKLAFSDLELSHASGRRNVTDFKGTMLCLECDREVQHPLIVQETRPKKGEFILTENPAFDARFFVVCEDRNEALTILNQQFTEQLIAADDHAIAVTCMKFTGSRVYIMLSNNRDLFEFREGTTISDYQRICHEDLDYLMGYLDILIESTMMFDPDRITPKPGAAGAPAAPQADSAV